MDTKWIKIRSQKLIYGLVVPKIVSPILVGQTTIMPCIRTDTVHMLLEMEYLYPLLLNPKAYYLLHKLQICLKVRVAPPILGTHIMRKWFFVMWKIDNLEWREYLTYNIICYYIQYHEPRGYGMLEFTIRCLSIYTLHYYYRLEIDYERYEALQ